MKQKVKVFIFLLLVTSLSFYCGPKESFVQLEVTVLEEGTSVKIEGANVNVFLSGNSQQSLNTGQDGIALFNDLLEETSYTVKVSKIGYDDKEQNVVTLKDGKQSTTIILTKKKSAITITSPISSTNWQTGTLNNITWTSIDLDASADLKIELFKGATVSKTLESSTKNDGTYEWTIDNSIVAGTDYKIKISYVADANVKAESDYFKIYNFPAPTATTTNYTNLKANSVTLNGTVNANGRNTTVTFLWGTSESTLTNSVNATPNTLTDNSNVSVTCDITNLSPNNIYYYKVRAVSDGGTADGSVINFTTPALSKPIVITLDAATVNPTGATLNGSVNANGLETTVIFEYGTTIGYGQTINASPNSVNGTTNTNVMATITGTLSPSTIYHYRVVATSSAGTQQGEDKTFTTTSAGSPAVTTGSENNVNHNSAYFSGNITSFGTGATQAVQYGHIWSTTNSNLTLETCGNNKTQLGTKTTTGSYTSFIGGLISEKTYWVVAYCTNANATSYGVAKTFSTTMPNPAENITIYQPTNITQATADISAILNSFPIGVTSATAHGFCWSITENPTTQSSGHINLGATTSTDTNFNHTITGLSAGKTYYVRAYVTTSAGTLYSSQVIINTLNK